VLVGCAVLFFVIINARSIKDIFQKMLAKLNIKQSSK